MREYGQIQCSYWTAPEILPLPDAPKMLGAYLLTCEHSNGIGCYRLPLGYVRDDLKWTDEKVREALQKLFANGFIKHCDLTQYLFIPKFLYWNPIVNPNSGKARIKELDLVPSKFAYHGELIKSLKLYGDHLPNGWANHYLNGSGNHVSSPENNITIPEQDKTIPLPLQEKGNRKTSKRKKEHTLQEFLEACKAAGEDSIPRKDPIFSWAEKVGLDPQMIPAIWYKFKNKYLYDENNNDKKYKSWRQTFRNAVQDNWFGVFWIDEDKKVHWSSAGRTILRDMETKASDGFALNSEMGKSHESKNHSPA